MLKLLNTQNYPEFNCWNYTFSCFISNSEIISTQVRRMLQQHFFYYTKSIIWSTLYLVLSSVFMCHLAWIWKVVIYSSFLLQTNLLPLDDKAFPPLALGLISMAINLGKVVASCCMVSMDRVSNSLGAQPWEPSAFHLFLYLSCRWRVRVHWLPHYWSVDRVIHIHYFVWTC